MNMMHAQFIKIPYLYITLSFMCLSPYNIKRHYIPLDFLFAYICLRIIRQLFEVFNFFFTLNLFVHGRENHDRLMTLLLSKTKRLLIFYLLSGRLMSKMQLIVPPQNILQFNTNTRNTVEILFASPAILKVLAFSRVKPILFALILAS